MAKIQGKFTLVLESENLSAWMAINNTFTWAKGGKQAFPKDQYWNGVLIQLGQYLRWEDDMYMKGFEKIDLYWQGKVVETIERDALTDKDNPTWINVVVRDQKSKLKDPMSKKHLRDLHLDPGCPLDGFMRPYPGGVTLWSENGYRVLVETNPDHEPHMKYAFSTGSDDVYEVEIYLKGKTGRFPDIDKMVICEPADPSLQQGGHQGPPQK